MRAPSNRRSDKRIDDETAIKEASRRLEPLFVDGISWSERGADTRKKFRTAIALVESALAEAERVLSKTVRVLNKTGKRALNKRTKGTIANAIANAVPFIKLARKAAIPELRQARPSIGRHGRYGDLNASRNQTIAETVASIRKQFGLSQEQASSVVSETLESLVREHKQVFEYLIKMREADPAWIEECLKFVGKLGLSEDSVEDIAKKYRTVRE